MSLSRAKLLIAPIASRIINKLRPHLPWIARSQTGVRAAVVPPFSSFRSIPIVANLIINLYATNITSVFLYYHSFHYFLSHRPILTCCIVYIMRDIKSISIYLSIVEGHGQSIMSVVIKSIARAMHAPPT